MDSQAVGGAAPATYGLKNLVLLFVLFLVAVSDLALHNLLAFVPGALEGRAATDRGVAAQGVLLVILFALSNFLIDEGLV